MHPIKTSRNSNTKLQPLNTDLTPRDGDLLLNHLSPKRELFPGKKNNKNMLFPDSTAKKDKSKNAYSNSAVKPIMLRKKKDMKKQLNMLRGIAS